MLENFIIKFQDFTGFSKTEGTMFKIAIPKTEDIESEINVTKDTVTKHPDNLVSQVNTKYERLDTSTKLTYFR